MLRLKFIYHNVGNVYIFQNRSFHLVRRSIKSSTKVWNVLTVHIKFCRSFLQELEMPSNLINHIFRCGTNSQHGFRSGSNLSPSCVSDQGERDLQRCRVISQREKLLFSLTLDRNLRLPGHLPGFHCFLMFFYCHFVAA